MSGSVEDPTPLTSGPAPAYRIRLPDPPPPVSPPPVSPPPVSPPPSGGGTGTGTGSNPTPPASGGSGSGSQPGSGQTSSGQGSSATGSQQTPSNPPPVTQTPPAVAQAPPVATQTQEPVTTGPVGSTGPLRLVLPVSSGDGSPNRVVQVAASTSDAGKAPLIVLRLHATDEASSSPNLPSGALLQFNVAALGGVRATDQLSLLTGPPRLNLPQPEAVNADTSLWLAQVPMVGGEEVVERLILGGGWDNTPSPLGGPGFPGSWLFWPINPLIWGWITSPLMPSLPLAESAPGGPEEAEPAALVQPTGAADDTFGVDASWAGALLAAGLLSVPKADQERTPCPIRATPRRRGQPDADR
jgi:hypothetical protein